MSVYDREQQYIHLLSEREYTVAEIAKLLFVSEPTVRRDVLALEKKELLTCHRGNLKLKSRYADQRIPLFLRTTVQNAEKQIIASKAVKYIHDGDVLMLDASTTAYHLLPYLTEFKNLLIITNGAKTALEAASLGIRTFCTGGEITMESFSYVGADAVNMLLHYNADIAFFSCLGITDDGKITDSSLLENDVRRVMMHQSRRQFVLCDSSKFGNSCLHTLCTIDDVTGVITENT